MIKIKKRTNSFVRGSIVQVYHFVDPERISDDGVFCRSYQISVWDDNSYHYKVIWFPMYRLNMTVYEDVSWLEILVLFNLTKARLNRIFRRIDILDRRNQ